MKFKVTQKNLNNCLKNIVPFSDKNHQLDLIKNLHIKASKNLLEITATDIHTYALETIQGSSKEDGEITVPAVLFRDYIQSLSTEDDGNKSSIVELTLDKNKLLISCQKIQASINCLPADEFPTFPINKDGKSPILTLKASELKNALKKVVFAANKDFARPSLASILLYCFSKQIYLVATDSYRLAEQKIKVAKSHNNLDEDVQILIPATTLNNLDRILTNYMDSQISIYKDDDKKYILFVFNEGEIQILSSLTEATYPDYRKLLPEDFKTVLTLNRQDLINTAKRTRLFSQEIAPSIVLNWTNDKLNVKSSASQIGENEETIDAKISIKDETDNTITLNVKYLQDVLQVIESDQVDLGINGKLDACIITPHGSKLADYRHAIMPLKS